MMSLSLLRTSFYGNKEVSEPFKIMDSD